MNRKDWSLLDTLLLFLIIVGIVLIIWVVIVIANPPTNTTNNTISLSSKFNPLVDSQYQVEFKNETNQLLLLGMLGPTVATTNEGTLELEPGKTLTLNVPIEWTNTAGNSSKNGPRFWARTGCKFDKEKGVAQCEIGNCGNQYDCSKASLGGQIPVSLAEFCFECGDKYTYYDVSLVDGYSLSINIEPLTESGVRYCSNDSPENKCPGFNPDFCCKCDLCDSRYDLRATCPESHQLTASMVSSYIWGGSQPENEVIACFSNCGYYEYPTAPAADCDETTDIRCRGWRRFCCQAPADNPYDQPCTNTIDQQGIEDVSDIINIDKYPRYNINVKNYKCPNNNNVENNNNIGQNGKPCPGCGSCYNGKCVCSSFNLNPNCPPEICTNPDSVPPPKLCSDCDGEGLECIGDDTVGKVCPYSFQWPNAAETFQCLAKRFRVTFGLGTQAPVAPSGPIPNCSDLPTQYYNYGEGYLDCIGNKPLGNYMCARKNDSLLPWGCPNNGVLSSCDGVICLADKIPNIPAVDCNTLPENIYNTKDSICNGCSIPNKTDPINYAIPGQNWACSASNVPPPNAPNSNQPVPGTTRCTVANLPNNYCSTPQPPPVSVVMCNTLPEDVYNTKANIINCSGPNATDKTNYAVPRQYGLWQCAVGNNPAPNFPGVVKCTVNNVGTSSPQACYLSPYDQILNDNNEYINR